jgi:hypothetical protein
MQVLVNIMMMPDDEPLSLSPEEIADGVLRALGGDETKDHVTSSIQQMPVTGTFGAVPPLPEVMPGPPAE